MAKLAQPCTGEDSYEQFLIDRAGGLKEGWFKEQAKSDFTNGSYIDFVIKWPVVVFARRPPIFQHTHSRIAPTTHKKNMQNEKLYLVSHVAILLSL